MRCCSAAVTLGLMHSLLNSQHTATPKAEDANPNGLLPSKYYPALDGFRAIAVLMVFFHHYVGIFLGQPHRLAFCGWIGVDFFFVLSGFLITGILYDSQRLWPLHLGNYARFIGGHASTNGYIDVLIPANNLPWITYGHFWSLCIEEQFYLFWPFVVYRLRDRVRLIYVCVAVIIVSPILRMLTQMYAPAWILSKEVIYRALPLRMDALLFGALLALLIRGPERIWLQRWRTVLLLAGIGSMVAYFAFLIYQHRMPHPAEGLLDEGFSFTVIDFAAAAIILTLIHESSLLARLLRFSLLRKLGMISYGFYVFHDLFRNFYIAFAVKHFPSHAMLISVVIGLLATLTMSVLSYHFYETPFLRLKRKFPGQRHSAPAV